MPNVIIYSTPTCPFCKLAKAFFKRENVAYQEKDVSTDAAARDEMVAKSGQMGVPVIDINGQLVVGFDEPKLTELLGVGK